MCWLIEKKDGYAKIAARKDSEFATRVDFTEFRFIESGGIYTCYTVLISKPEGAQPLPEEKGSKWEPTYPLKAWFQIDSNGTMQEKAACKVLATLDASECYSGFLSIQNTPFCENIVSGLKADGTPLTPDMAEMLLAGIGSFKNVEATVIKPDDVKPVEKRSNGGKQYKSRAEVAGENFAAIKAMLGSDTVPPDASFMEVATCINMLESKDAILALLSAMF